MLSYTGMCFRDTFSEKSRVVSIAFVSVRDEWFSLGFQFVKYLLKNIANLSKIIISAFIRIRSYFI
jgi:hypothetical protein